MRVAQRLDNPPDIKPDIRRSLVIAMQGLARKNDIFPKHFTLQGVTVLANDPVVVGHFADIYKGRFNRDRVVCLKMIKVSEMEGIVKVTFNTMASCKLYLIEHCLAVFTGSHSLGSVIASESLTVLWAFSFARSRMSRITLD
jgi:hypothetical protein